MTAQATMNKLQRTRRIEQAHEICGIKGERLTEGRELVLDRLLKYQRPLSAYELLARVQKKMPHAKPPTVYRALEFLTRMNLVHRLESSNSFMACNHFGVPHKPQFLYCVQCSLTKELDVPTTVIEILHLLAADSGFTVDTPIIEISGYCKQCQASR